MKIIKNISLNNLIILFLIIPIVFPNSMRNLSLPIFIILGGIVGIFSFASIGRIPILIYLMIAINSVVYIFIGLNKSHPDSLGWLFFSYIISPFIWLILCNYLLKKNNISKIINLILFYSVLGCISVYLFMYLFLFHGPDSVLFFINEPNVEFSDGRVGVTMHVLGSLIFISTAFIASPSVVSRSARLPLIILFLITAIVSGRVALLLAVVMGFAINLLSSNSASKLKLLFYGILSICGAILVIGYLSNKLGESEINIFLIISEAIDKIIQGGGDARSDQFNSLLEGIYEFNLLGAGHGVSASVIRNDVSPWKYELLYLSTIFHTGIFGFLIYSIPVFLVILSYFNLVKNNKSNNFDLFLLSGFLSIIFASGTNPYLQSFDFQWMFVLPCVYFGIRFVNLVRGNR
jgi:hypothetical protein